ncbi:hypothetical protein V8C43DRAFT_79362 [Trichoderma afarasin]
MSSVGLRPRGHLSLPIRRTPGRRSYVFASVVAGPLRGMPPIHSQREPKGPCQKAELCAWQYVPRPAVTRGERPLTARDWTSFVWGFTISNFFPLFPPSMYGTFCLPCGSGFRLGLLVPLPHLRIINVPTLTHLSPIYLTYLHNLVSRNSSRVPSPMLGPRPGGL